EIDDVAAEGRRRGDQLCALLRRRAHLQEQQLALDRLAGGELGHAEHVDELVNLLLDLLERVLLAVDAQRDAGDTRPFGRSDGKRVDVEAAAGEHRRDARERSGLVLHHDAQGALHWRASCSSGSSYSTISSAAAPAGIIGKHCSDWSTRQSTTAVRPDASASCSAGPSSSSVSTVMPSAPYASARRA